MLLVASIFFAAVFYAAGNGFLNAFRRRPLGPNWAAATSEYLVFAVFALGFGGKVAHQSLIYAPFLLLAVAAIGMRVTRRKTQALASEAAAGD